MTEEEATYPRYDDEGQLIVEPPVVPTEEDEVPEEDGGILNTTQTSVFGGADYSVSPDYANAARDIRPERRLHHSTRR